MEYRNLCNFLEFGKKGMRNRSLLEQLVNCVANYRFHFIWCADIVSVMGNEKQGVTF